jgi:nicotinamidase/pyrazinamidase
MTRALLVIDVQKDFTERVDGAHDLPGVVTRYLRETAAHYPFVIASRDWHDADNDNGGHFPLAPPGSTSRWITHCVAGTRGAEYSTDLDTSLIDVHIRKGQGKPAYSIFEGATADGEPMADIVRRLGITEVDVVGIATEHCVAAAARDALAHGIPSRILGDLCRAIDPARAELALQELAALGVGIERT